MFIRASGYDYELACSQDHKKSKNKNRRRINLLYFNAPFCKRVAKRVRKFF